MSDTKFVVFIDALSPNDLSRAEFLPNTMEGEMESLVPRVTPDVMSEVYTGDDSAENGMGRIHADDSRSGENSRPETETIIETAMSQGESVCALNMPYAGPPREINQESAIHTTFTGEDTFAPQQAQSVLNIPGPAGDLVGEPNHQTAFDLMVDYATSMFATARTLSQNHDLIFIGFRNIDSYCHFQYDTGPDGRHAGVGNRYRDLLTEVIDIQLKQLENHGDVFWFSDHGATNRDETFRVNKWLSEKGYLDYEYDEKFVEKAKEHGLMPPQPDGPDARVQNQIVPGQPGVDVNRMEAVCSDPYDSGITVLDEDGVTKDLIDEMSSLDYYRDVYHKSDLHNEEAEYYEGLPDIIPDRAEGVFVSGNIHEEPIGMGWHRTGVHDKWGCYGGTTGIGGGTATPSDINQMLNEFLGLSS